MKVRNRFAERRSVKPRVADIQPGIDGAKQSMKAECDINNIVNNYMRTGQLQHVGGGEPQYGFVPAVTFHEALNIVAEARSLFEELPAQARKRFRNDPGVFLAYMEKGEGSAQELVDMGLAADSVPVRLAQEKAAAQRAAEASAAAPATPASTPAGSPPTGASGGGTRST